MEIERKFLVHGMPALDFRNFSAISQGYISIDPEVRIRKRDDKFFLTAKGDGTLVRKETEIEIDAVTYEILLGLVKNNLIEKTRYIVPVEPSFNAELDIYHGNLAGLVTAEVEFPTVDSSKNFTPPKWFGREVTEDKRFKNKNLSSLDSPYELLEAESALTKKKV